MPARRRLLALLTMFVMFRVAVAGGDVACGPGGDDHRGVMTRMTDASAAPAAAEHSGHGEDSHAPCDMSASRHCCDAMTSCGVVALGAPPIPTPVRVDTRAARASGEPDLLSRARGPEPPPPRA